MCHCYCDVSRPVDQQNTKVVLLLYGCCFAGYAIGFPTGRDSTTFRDNGTSSKSYQGTGRAGTAKIWDRTGRDSQNPGRDAGQNGTEQKRMF